MSNVIDIRIKLMIKALESKRFKNFIELNAYQKFLKLTNEEMTCAMKQSKAS